MGIALQVFVNLSKLLETQGAGACDAECVKWMVELVREAHPGLLNVSDPGNAHTMAASIAALDLAAGKLSDDGIGRRRRREINGALAHAIRLVDDKHMASELSETEAGLVKLAKTRLGGGRGQSPISAPPVDIAPVPAAVPQQPALSAWSMGGSISRGREIDAIRGLRVGDGMDEDEFVRIALPEKGEILTENLDASIRGAISETTPERRIDWIGLALIGLALAIPPMGLFMSGAAWAMEQKGRSMVLAVLAVAGSFAWAMAS